MAFTRAQQIALDRDRWFAMKNPNAVSPQTYRQLVGDQEQNRVRAHEMAMLQQQQGRNDIGVQAEKNLGIEKEWAGRKGIAEMEEETKREANKARFGYHKDIGDGMTVYQNGSEATAARYAAGSASEAEKAKGEGLLALEKQKLETLKQEGVNAVNLENERTGGLIEVEDTRGKNAIALQKQQGADAMTLAKEQTRTAETRARSASTVKFVVPTTAAAGMTRAPVPSNTATLSMLTLRCPNARRRMLPEVPTGPSVTPPLTAAFK